MTTLPAPTAGDVVAFVAGTGVELPADFGPQTQMLSSGVLDSLGLFLLFEWVAEQVGGPLDVLELDLTAEWDTPADVAAFVGRRLAA